MDDSINYNLNGNDKTAILGTRATLLQKFEAPNWSDLRLAILFSATKESDPNDPTGLAEAIGSAGEDNNQVYLGFKQADSLFPRSTNFFGISTQQATPAGATTLSDGGDFLQWTNSGGKNIYASNGTTRQNETAGTTSPRVQDKIVSPTYSGYQTLIILRMLRLDPTLELVDSLEVGGADVPGYLDDGVPFKNNLSITNIRSIVAAAAYTSFLGPFSFTKAPDAIFMYWPWVNSRLRVHGYVLEQYA